VTLLDDFLLRAALAAVGTAMTAGLLGCFVVWRRMAYFGDATAHAAVLGVALALLFGTSITLGVAVVALLMAVLIHALSGRGVAVDTVLGVLAHGALALGLVAVTLVPGQRIDLDAYLFGDVLAVTRGDLALIWGGGAVVMGVLWWQWSAMLTATLSPDLAYAAGINPRKQQLILTLLLAAVVALAIQVVGALLITALLIIPAASARGFARGPESMAVLAMGIGALAALGGLRLALIIDTAVGPAIICVAVGLFALSLIARLFRA
jgi:zinc transport system permease protein